MTPEEMIEILLDSHSSNGTDGKVVNDLLAEFGRGYPISNLRRLFVPTALGDAAFLVSELGQKARPLLQEIAELVEHSSPRIRGDAVDALSRCTTWEDGWAVAKIVKALGDQHEGVRWTAWKALRYMESSQIQSGLDYLHSNERDSAFAGFSSAFFAIERRPNMAVATLKKLLQSDDPVARRFGAAMVARPRLFIDPNYVTTAAITDDAEVATWVAEATEAPLPPWAQWEPLRQID